jgi:hypothetical protein
MVGRHPTLGGFWGIGARAMVISEGTIRDLPDALEGTIMNRSRTRLALTFLAPAVLGLGVTSCTQGAGTSPQTAGLGTTITPAPPASSAARSTAPGETTARTAPETIAPKTTAPKTTAPRVTAGYAGLGTSSVRRGPSSAACLPEKKWGIGPKGGGTAMSTSALYLTRAGRHDCYDRVVFDINGSQAVSFVARYVPVVLADGSGQRVPVPGRAALEVIVRAPILGADSQGHQPWRTVPRVAQDLVAPSAVSGWSSLRAVRFAGSFEGQTTVAVGVRERRPFRVWVRSEQGYKHVVLDIAH